MPNPERQTNVDIPTLTRSEVAKRLGRDVSWVRRREGKELHPRFFDGAHQFDEHEVEALRAQLESKHKEAEVSEAANDAIHQMFELHARAPRRFSIDGISERTGASPHAVRSMHTKWLEEQGPDAPRLLSRKDLRATEAREAEREHVKQLAAWAREDEELAARRAAEAKRRDDEYAQRDAERREAHFQRERAMQSSFSNARMNRHREGDLRAQLDGLGAIGAIGAALQHLLHRRTR